MLVMSAVLLDQQEAAAWQVEMGDFAKAVVRCPPPLGSAQEEELNPKSVPH